MIDRVVVIGDLMVDVVVRPMGPLQHASDVPAQIRTSGGGSAANTACWLASVGQPVALAAMVGADPVGSGSLAELQSAGVEFAGTVRSDASTGTCVLLIDATGERTMLPDRGANDHLDDATVDQALDAGACWVHLSGYSLLDDGSRPAAIHAIERCRAEGLPFSVDASSAAPIRSVGADRILQWIEGCRILFANDDEVAALGGIGACRRASEAVVAKHGPGGVSWLDASGARSQPAVPVPVVDTVGAGDALDAGVIASVVAGGSPEQSLLAGVEVAAQAVSGAGGRPHRDRSG